MMAMQAHATHRQYHSVSRVATTSTGERWQQQDSVVYPGSSCTAHKDSHVLPIRVCMCCPLGFACVKEPFKPVPQEGGELAAQ